MLVGMCENKQPLNHIFLLSQSGVKQHEFSSQFMESNTQNSNLIFIIMNLFSLGQTERV